MTLAINAAGHGEIAADALRISGLAQRAKPDDDAAYYLAYFPQPL
jgi:hypothetical protein